MTTEAGTAEQRRLAEARDGESPWRKRGPYLSERQWGTVREDYSESGDAWNYFTHDQARSRAYHWGEDGLAGFSDDKQRLCFALAHLVEPRAAHEEEELDDEHGESSTIPAPDAGDALSRVTPTRGVGDMLSARLIQLIETHSEALTREVLQDLATNPKTRSFQIVPRAELESRMGSLYRNLGGWIGDPRDDAVQAEYEEWGRRPFRQGIPLSEIVYLLILIKHHLRRYIRDHGLVASSSDPVVPGEFLAVHLHGVQELNFMVGEFFDRALYHLARGYEAEAQVARGAKAP